MRIGIITRSVLFLVMTMCVTITLQNTGPPVKRQTAAKNPPNSVVRTDYTRKVPAAKPGFFRTLFSTMFEQWSETKKVVNDVNRILDNNFLPENAPPTTAAPPNPNPNVTTTAAPFKLKRSELIALMRRNFLGIGRLVDIEVKTALENSEREWPEYRRNFTREVSKFL